MKPGKARKDRPKGVKSFSRGSNKRVERSAVARPEKRDNRRDDKKDERRPFRSDDKKTYKKSDRGNERNTKRDDRNIKRDDRKSERGEKRFDRKQFSQDAVAGKNSVVEALRAKVPAKELVVAIKVEIDEKIQRLYGLPKMLIYQLKSFQGELLRI